MPELSTPSITSVLVANRSEIARRVFATCRKLGLGTVAVYSDADADSPHVSEADAAVHLPGTSSAETYLRGELIIAAAKATGADAIHPGYGFLSENADFARAVADAGLTWIGPPVAAIESMGSKIESKKLMDSAGVPVLGQLDPETVTAAELPVLVKASAGGGGRGMRIVSELDKLPAEIAAAQREAQSAFGDPTVFCERYLGTGRHIEVQVMADTHGTVWAVGERECSIQRRHQKVIEEAPSPLVNRVDGMRERLYEASRTAATAIGYAGAGTMEFLATEDGEFFFLEMNTRLQVEHPVTECTTGLDLVALQIQVADGARLPAEPPAIQGHSIEARLYAENPAAGWQPQSGTVRRFDIPGSAAEFHVPGHPGRNGIRLDSTIVDGSVVSVHYDPMLAKVITVAPTRTEAARLLASTLERARIHGLTTNRDLLVNVLRHPAFLDGDTDTSFLDKHGLDTLAKPLADEAAHQYSALAAALADAAANRASAVACAAVPSGWRNLRGPSSGFQSKEFTAGESTIGVRYRLTRTGLELDSTADTAWPAIELVSATPEHVALVIDGVRRGFDIANYGDSVDIDSPLGPVALTVVPRFTDPSTEVAAGSLIAPMPGVVLRLGAAVGDTVTAGTPIVWLEAMKMEHTIAAPADGVIEILNVEPGQQVELGTVLAQLTADANTEGEPT
ncbi:biotin carboxylase N-terminal domain-containing protein [Mycobacteroides franklinii]|uniref:biotin carboxylase n=1 Tax=Mycobacteroides franklinii TaxID=948102 RepID=A0A4R8QSW2_9MYCO|nr:biotin carboxylase N-terminal domain-containing protein [Mycobacteroides franklinii]TDZ41701.1 Acetyl-/propionyl-coenzyme A carboxylase alpha chain [Mycobacteroides franklinii]TDZ47126.1 Acetyl-/propionyl-coenzyme A carboxylase alpha chain [Mycobacteroides franklinii]TDZ55255.1 Acetyl-/propionyl-coenzyme A carboxylase alpha chain [Mycobacteroides franklinii]TDZ62196.1 Acetyl-/propionyl-coenzyme A carboxylase alpha chain [Mycobacteroides franklinii]TDZ68594.1 Acetyl-/propionyl-coenzyme A car